MLRPERANAMRRAQIVQSLALQGVLALVVVVAAVLSRDRPFVFWLTLSLLAVPVSISVVYLRALRKIDNGPKDARR